MPSIIEPFINNIYIYRPKLIYNNKEVAPGIRKYILKYIINLDKVLTNVKLLGYIILSIKSI